MLHDLACDIVIAVCCSRISSICCCHRSASERICRLQEALDERRQQFNKMATKYDMLC